MAGGELLELKFRLYDGTDIGPHKYAPAATIATLKESILAKWPQGKANAPKTINDMKLINAGRILENNKTLADSRVPVGEVPGGVITMLVVVHPQLLNRKEGVMVFGRILPDNSEALHHLTVFSWFWNREATY